MVKYVLLKQYIPGRTFDMFRSNGYDILQMVETDEIIDIPKDSLERIIREHIKNVAVATALKKRK